MSFEEDKSGRKLGNARLGVMSPLRRQMAEEQEEQDQEPELPFATPSISRSELIEGSKKKPAVEKPFSDGLSNSGLSVGSDCSSLSGVSVHLPTWMDDAPKNTKH